MKYLVSIILVFVLACGGDDNPVAPQSETNPLLGTWQINKVDMIWEGEFQTVESPLAGGTVNFTQSTFSINMEIATMTVFTDTAIYTKTPTTLVLKFASTTQQETWAYTVVGNNLTLSAGGATSSGGFGSMKIHASK